MKPKPKPKKRNPNPPPVRVMSAEEYRQMLKGRYIPESWK